MDPIRLCIPYAGAGAGWVVRRETTLVSRADTFEAIEQAARELGSALAEFHHTTLEIRVQTAQGQWKIIEPRPPLAPTHAPQTPVLGTEAH